MTIPVINVMSKCLTKFPHEEGMDSKNYIVIEPRMADRTHIAADLTRDGHFVLPFERVEDAVDSMMVADYVLVRDVRGLVDDVLKVLSDKGLWRPVIALGIDVDPERMRSDSGNGALGWADISRSGREIHHHIIANVDDWTRSNPTARTYGRRMTDINPTIACYDACRTRDEIAMSVGLKRRSVMVMPQQSARPS